MLMDAVVVPCNKSPHKNDYGGPAKYDGDKDD